MTDQREPGNGASDLAPLRIGYVAGVTLTKWRQRWHERFPRQPLELIEVDQPDQRRVLDDGLVDMCFARLPVSGEPDFHVISLYEEMPVLWVSKEHLLSALDEVSSSDLAEENVFDAATPMNIDLVASGHGVLPVPMSIARTHSRRDLTYRPIVDAPTTTIALVWRRDNEHPLIQEFIGIVRGRTVNSSRTAQERRRSPGATRAKEPKNTRRDSRKRRR